MAARLRRLVTLAFLAVSALAVSAAPASAVVIYPNAASFGPDGSSFTSFTGASQLAFDQASKRLYVLNVSPTPASVFAFDASTAGTFNPLGGPPFITGLATPGTNPDLAVDNTAGASAGRIYYVSQSAGTLTGFNSAGASLGAPFAPLTPPAPKTLCGGAVDSAGNIAIGNSNNSAKSVLRYDGAGVALTSISTSATGAGNPCEVAFDSNDDLYFALSNGAAWRYTTVSGYSSASAQQFDAVATRALAVDRVTHRLYVLHSNKVNVYDSTGAPVAEFATGLSSNLKGIAVNETTGAIYVSDASSGTKVRVFTPVNAPLPTTGSSSAITRNGATVAGHVEPDGGGKVTECRFEYVTDAIFNATGYTDLASGGKAQSGSKACTQALPYSSGIDVSASLTGLTAETKYHYRLVTANATPNSTNPGADMTFTTPVAVADVATEGVSNVKQTSATLHGSFTGDGLPTTYSFEWGPTTAYGNTVGGSAGSGTGKVSVSAPVSGLAVYLPSSQPYHYRLVATNSTGSSKGPDKTFLPAPPDPPAISGVSVDEVTPTSATLAANINPGNGPTIYRVEYGTDASYGAFTSLSESIGEDDTAHPVSSQLVGIVPGTTYHFRLVATNFGGTSHSTDQTFTTPSVPGIASSEATAIGQSTAYLTASVVANASPTSVTFEYGTSPAYGLRTSPAQIGADLLSRESGASLTGLAPGTTYHFRAVATNAIGTTNGPHQTFTTQVIPQNPSGGEGRSIKCKKGFVKRKGKCVKRKQTKRKQQRHSNPSHG